MSVQVTTVSQASPRPSPSVSVWSGLYTVGQLSAKSGMPSPSMSDTEVSSLQQSTPPLAGFVWTTVYVSQRPLLSAAVGSLHDQPWAEIEPQRLFPDSFSGPQLAPTALP